MSEIKLPAIIKYTMHNHIALCFENGHAYHLDGEFKGEWSDDYYIDHTARNHTTEYLANTYGEVKSKEHAEFIKLLAETNGIPCSHHIIDGCFKYFYFTNEVLFFTTSKVPLLTDCKQITIPLPPECEENPNIVRGGNYKVEIVKPNKVLSNGEVYELCSHGNYLSASSYDANHVKYDCKSLENLKKASDFKVVSDDEWPKVNDDVFYNGQKWTFVAKHNDMAMLFWTGDEYCTAKISELQKPKTQEQELRDEIIRVIHDDVYNGMYGKESFAVFADALMSKFEITKKPQ